MVFGKVMNCPTLQVNKAVTGTTLTGVGVLSGLDLWATLPDGGDDSQYFLSLLHDSGSDFPSAKGSDVLGDTRLHMKIHRPTRANSMPRP